MTEPDYTQPDVTLLGEDHIRAYRESGGEIGYLWNGVPTLLLTTTGRKSGSHGPPPSSSGGTETTTWWSRRMGGAPEHPQWYRNLTANPNGRNPGQGGAHTGRGQNGFTGREAPLWSIVSGVWPNYDVYKTRTDRYIPVVVLTPTTDG